VKLNEITLYHVFYTLLVMIKCGVYLESVGILTQESHKISLVSTHIKRVDLNTSKSYDSQLGCKLYQLVKKCIRKENSAGLVYLMFFTC
jgi:hypothetical protein